MAIIEKLNFNSKFFLNQTIEQKERIETKTNLKVADYFDSIYNYPPKVRIKWDSLDNFKPGPSSKTKLSDSSPAFLNEWFVTDLIEDTTSEKFPPPEYVDGYLDKINSSRFFNEKTKTIQTSLSSVPIYLILNGHGEIVLSKPSNLIGSRTLKAYLNQAFYDFCGSFDKGIEKRPQLGLFFLSKSDAETYLDEIAKFDVEGTKTVGLSIYCLGLDSAYKITREYHPGIDFRFVPKFDEVKNLLKKNLTKSNIIVEKEQVQLKRDYFKGVPIYIVKSSNNSRNLIAKQYFNIIEKLDGVAGKIFQPLNYLLRKDNNWIMQGSLKDNKNSKQFINHIFFEKDQAIEFIKNGKKNIQHFKGSRTKNAEFLVRKPKIFVYNLEDFLEDWEDKINNDFSINKETTSTLFNAKKTYFETRVENLEELSECKKTLLKNIGQTLNIKFKVLTRFIGVFFSVS